MDVTEHVTAAQEAARREAGLLTKEEVVSFLDTRAQSYKQDALILDSLIREAPGDWEGQESTPGKMRAIGHAFAAEARAFDEHGPLPVLSDAKQKKPVGGGARCPSWPEGCGERSRYASPDALDKPRGRRGPQVVYHRPGCAVAQALRADAIAGDRGH